VSSVLKGAVKLINGGSGCVKCVERSRVKLLKGARRRELKRAV
jgi:hypothetical protein